MDAEIIAILLQDGLTNGAIYMLLALAFVLVFSVTRILFLPQGEFVVFGALGFALLVRGQLPGTVWLLLTLGAFAMLLDMIAACRTGTYRRMGRSILGNLIVPSVLCGLTWMAARNGVAPAVAAILAIALVVPLGPLIYRIGFMPVAHASILNLMFISVTIHFSLVGMSLFFFGPEGMRTAALVDAGFTFGDLLISGQSLLVYGVCAVLVLGLYLLFEKTLTGKALRATAMDRTGARLLGVHTQQTGTLAFALAAFIGAVCGVLMVSLSTVYYDSGLTIGMRGFIGAVVGALVSFPATAVGALAVGILESFLSFSWSLIKDAALFLLIIPVLLYLSIRHRASGEQL